MAAAAWADGEIQDEEAVLIRGFLDANVGPEHHSRAEADAYLDLPIDEDERLLLVEDLLQCINSDEDRRFAMQSVKSVFDAHGDLTAPEMDVICQIQKVIVGGRVAFEEEFSRLSSSRLGATQVSAYQSLMSRLDESEIVLEGHSDNLRKLVLVGYWMARVANSDGDIDDMEVAVMKDALSRTWGLDRASADFVSEIAASLEYQGIDEKEAAHDFTSATTYSERLSLIEVLLAVCMADGIVQRDEILSVKAICELLKLKAADIDPLLNQINRRQW